MKKILLATTALAVVGVIAPASADTNIGAYYEFGWASTSDDTTGDDKGADSHTYQNSEIHFNFSTVSDSGLEFGARFEVEGAADGSTSVSGDGTVSLATTDESSLYVKGDFGKLELGQNDSAHSSFVIWAPTHRGTYGQDDGHYFPRFAAPHNAVAKPADIDADTATPVELLAYARELAAYNAGSTGTGTTTRHIGHNVDYNDREKISYFSPNFSGVQFGVSWTDGNTGDGSDESADQSFGVSYTLPGMMGSMMDDGMMMGGIDLKVAAAVANNGEDGTKEVENSSFGIKLGYSDVTLTASTANHETDKTDVDSTEFGVGYALNDQISFGASFTNSEDDKNKHDLSTVGVSAEYIVVPGLSAVVAFNTYDLKDDINNRKNDGSVMVFSLRGDF